MTPPDDGARRLLDLARRERFARDHGVPVPTQLWVGSRDGAIIDVGEVACVWCSEPCSAADDRIGGVDVRGAPLDGRIHRECAIRGAIGSVGHQNRQCFCYGGEVEDPPGMTRREAARAAAELWLRRAP